MGSTDQADPRFFLLQNFWVLMEQHCFYFFHPLHFVRGLRNLEHWLLQKLSMKTFDQKFRYFGALIFQEWEFFDHLKYNFNTSWPQKISIFKILFDTIFNINLMIKKGPYLFPSLKSKLFWKKLCMNKIQFRTILFPYKKCVTF